MKYFAAGEVVAVRVWPVVHKGIVSVPGWGPTVRVISNSRRRGCVAEEPLAVFTDGREFWSEGYPGDLTPGVVVARARARCGRPWDVLRYNCEHFVRDVHGLPLESPQLQVGVGLAGAAALLAIAVVATSGTKPAGRGVSRA